MQHMQCQNTTFSPDCNSYLRKTVQKKKKGKHGKGTPGSRCIRRQDTSAKAKVLFAHVTVPQAIKQTLVPEDLIRTSPGTRRRGGDRIPHSSVSAIS